MRIDHMTRSTVPYSSSVLPNYNNVTPLAPLRAVNQVHQWSTTVGGADIDLPWFMKDRINLAVSYFRNGRDNQITGMLVTPAYTGLLSVTANSLPMFKIRMEFNLRGGI